MKNNLSIAGSEIINESKSKYNNNDTPNNSLNKDEQKQKIISKVYKISDDNIPNINNNLSKKIENHTEKNESQTKKLFSLDLSKIKYNDGYILTDAANSNPGFGLWALKIPSSDKSKDRYKKDNSINTNRKSINNISTINNNLLNNSSTKKITITTNNISMNNKINDKSLSLTINSKNEENKKRNKLLIEQLKMKCDDLESKCTNVASNLDQRIYMCNNSIKLKRDYEKILNENMKEIKLINEKCSNISLENAKLNNVYTNLNNEVNRLLNVMKTDKENMEKIKNEFNERLIEEEQERQRLNKILKDAQIKIKSLEEEFEEKLNDKKEDNNHMNFNIEIENKKDSKTRKEFEDENLNDVILELELKICGLKKKINHQEEENEKLRKIVRFKEEKNSIDKYKLKNMSFLLKFKIENQKNDLITVSQQDSLIKELRKKIHIKANKKINKSYSLRKVMK